MMQDKDISVINRTLAKYGIYETMEETKLSVIDCNIVMDKNKEVLNLFDKYDRDELSPEDIKMNLDNNILLKIKEYGETHNFEDI